MARRSILNRSLALVALVLVIVVAVLLTRALTMSTRQLAVQPATLPEIDDGTVATHLAEVIRLRTVSYEDTDPEHVAEKSMALAGLHDYLQRTYTQINLRLEREVVGRGSLLYTWRGSDPSLEPVLLAAHMDVVPAETTAETAWKHPPFEGWLSDGFVWGRGAIDDKLGVIGIVEAVEKLLEEGYQPKRTVYLAFGHDEELGGTGAAAIAALLRERNVKLDFVLDEGLPITVGIVPGITKPVALIGIAEKGYATVAMMVTSEGGHSSTPPPQTAIGIASAAVHALEQHPFPARFSGVAGDMFTWLGPEMGFGERFVFSNRWLFAPIVEHVLSQSPDTDALIRTTTAVTVMEGGVKDNVLPRTARVLVNFRSLPGDDPEDIVAHVRKAVNDERVKVELAGPAWGTDQPTPLDAPQFERLNRTVRAVYADTLVAPGLMLGATDARQYGVLTRNVFRFTPVPMKSEDVSRIHGIDERVSVEDLTRAVGFYYQLLRDAD
jgi:carboxypeptidase PM20D1